MDIIVAKFGGTSMGTAESMRAVVEILSGVSEKIAAGGDDGLKTCPAIAVVSATSGTTDGLIALGKMAVSGEDWKSGLSTLREKHAKICAEIGTDVKLDDLWNEIGELLERAMTAKSLPKNEYDHLIGFGERISSRILAGFLVAGGVPAEAVDAHDFIFTDDNFMEANVDFEKTNPAAVSRLMPLLEKGVLPVVTGFIGQAPNGEYTTLGRGGSDYTGGIVAAALAAKELQIWTDVDGIFNSDPRLILEAAALPAVSFNEASELAYFGAKVLHPKTIKPAIRKNIPVRVLNTFNPQSPGTLIDNTETESIKSVSYKKNIRIINICSTGMLAAHGFMAKIFDVFARQQVIVDVVSTSEVSVSVTVDREIKPELISELEKFSRVTVYENMAIVCVVGNGIKTHPDILGQLFSAIAGYPVSMVSQGASQRNVTFLVEEKVAPEIVKILFNTFFK